MPKPDRQLRQLVHDAIADRKRQGGYVVNDFELALTRRPATALGKAPPAGKVWVVGLAASDQVVTRSLAFTREIPVQVAVQLVLPDAPEDSEPLLDRYEDLEEELRDTARTLAHEHFSWLRTEPLRDENGVPFSFVGLREYNTFEAFFTAYYKVGLR
jgi:hypothetical protein